MLSEADSSAYQVDVTRCILQQTSSVSFLKAFQPHLGSSRGFLQAALPSYECEPDRSDYDSDYHSDYHSDYDSRVQYCNGCNSATQKLLCGSPWFSGRAGPAEGGMGPT